MLTDTQVKVLIDSQKIVIKPFSEKNLKAGKYDIHLGRYILTPINIEAPIDPTNPAVQPEYEKFDLFQDKYILEPGKFILGQTQELIGLVSSVGMFLDGSTTLARLGLTIHQTANFIPPGQDLAIITLEIANLGPWKIKLSNEMRIGKLLAFEYSAGNRISAKEFNRYNGQQITTGAIICPNNES